MAFRKLTSTNAFVVVDIADAPAAGIVRCAPKILVGGAEDLARSLTYSFATFGIQRSGASAGINAPLGEAEGAARAFAEELTADVAAGSLAFDAAKGVDEQWLAPLTAVDTRALVRAVEIGGDPLALHLAGLGPAVAADQAVGLDGKTVAIEGFTEHGPALAAAVEARGGRVVSVSTTAGSLTAPEGIGSVELRERWTARGPEMTVGEGEPAAAWKIYQSGADVLFAGSKMGAVTHTTAEKLEIAALVAHQPIPFTARALAVLTNKGATVLADFVSAAGPIFSWWPAVDADADAIVAAATEAIAAATAESMEHGDGAFLGACARAEAFLANWATVPFGRPLAS